MRFALIVAAVFSLKAFAVEMATGLALQGRVQTEVNPDYYETKALGQLFARIRVAPWSGLFELGEEQQRTSSGKFSVSNRSRTLGVWGRYEPWGQYAWSPYVAMGGGVFFDRVETQLGSERSTDSGRRLFAGAGAGIMRTLWQQCLVEIEARVQSIEQGRDPALSGLLRIGYIY